MGEVPANANALDAVGSVHHRFSIESAYSSRGANRHSSGQHKRLLSGGLGLNDQTIRDWPSVNFLIRDSPSTLRLFFSMAHRQEVHKLQNHPQL